MRRWWVVVVCLAAAGCDRSGTFPGWGSASVPACGATANFITQCTIQTTCAGGGQTQCSISQSATTQGCR